MVAGENAECCDDPVKTRVQSKEWRQKLWQRPTMHTSREARCPRSLQQLCRTRASKRASVCCSLCAHTR